jgi:uncharacterized small protein (DUF1192 family)
VKYPDERKKLANGLWEKLTANAYFEACERGGQRHAYIYDSRLSEYLTPERREQFLRMVLERPQLLKRTDWETIINFYYFYRTGSPGDALEVVGRWSRLNPNHEPRFVLGPFDYFRFNRQPCRNLMIGIGSHYEQHATMLENYLADPDGVCSLPVAYTLAYTYLVNGKIENWIAVLDQRLNDASVAADRRVNWLIARAHAAEIAGCPPTEHIIGRERLFTGRGWLDEGLLTAESDVMKARLYREIASRFAAKALFSEAANLLDEASTKLSDADAKQQLEACKAELKQVRDYAQELETKALDNARKHYLEATN